MSNYQETFTLPFELTNGNDGRGSKWFNSAKLRKKFEEDLRKLRMIRSPYLFPVKVHVVRVLGKGQRLWDSSSIGRGNYKELEDALVACGWFSDDSPKFITQTTFAQDECRAFLWPTDRDHDHAGRGFPEAQTEGGLAVSECSTCSEEFPRRTGRVIARFSCGAASAVATKLAIKKYGDAVEIYYNDTGSEHPDNARFLQSCEVWFQRKINVIKSEKFANIYEVFEKRKFLVSPQGAPCTSELKRIPGESVWNIGDVEILGYTADEAKRLERFRRDNNERIIECPLIDHHLTKQDCLGMLDRVGIPIPVMYKLGFRNNNCIGCVKARDSVDYWKRVRKYFPEQFWKTAELERRFKFTINRVGKDKTPIYLDEIEEGDPVGRDPDISCGSILHGRN